MRTNFHNFCLLNSERNYGGAKTIIFLKSVVALSCDKKLFNYTTL